ncbi:MAG: hypothetical protein JSV32_04250, partial [Dehalococcoidia bacterium]
MVKSIVYLVISTLFIITLLFVACAKPAPTPVPTPTPTMPKPEEVWLADGVIKVREYTANIQYGDYQIFWWSDDQYIYIGIRAETTGFVAVGIQPGSRMKNADMVFGFVKNGETNVYDMFSTGDFGPHQPDVKLGGTNDILEFACSEQDGFTTIEFKRPLDTGDDYDKPLSKGINKIIWSYGSVDELNRKHTNRG